MTQAYLGKWGGVLAALALMVAFVLWYAIELAEAAPMIKPCLPPNWSGAIAGFVLGGMIAVLSIDTSPILKGKRAFLESIS